MLFIWTDGQIFLRDECGMDRFGFVSFYTSFL
jgi:hypothetical protein